MTPFTIDELAALSDDEALRRDSNRRIRIVLRWTLRVFAVVMAANGVTTLAEGVGDHLPQVGAVAINATLIALLIAGFRRREKSGLAMRLSKLEPVSRLLDGQIRAVALSYLLVQFWFVLLVSTRQSGATAWLTVFPWIVLTYRLAPAERFAIHALYILTAVAGWLIPALPGGIRLAADAVVATAVVNVIALALGLFSRSRYRKRFEGDWKRTREEARERIRMRQELEYAREIQLSMLPRQTPEVSWLDLASVSVPATEVGGDYYDFFFPQEDQAVLVSADVAGHGLGSGLVLSGVRSGLTLLSADLERPEEVLDRLHGMIRRTTSRRMLVTMALLSLDRTRRVARYATAGHPPLLIKRSADGAIEEVLHPALPLGAGLATRFPVIEFGFEEGDIFLLHTDGLYETSDAAGNLYGLARLSRLMEQFPASESARELRDAILRDLWEFRDGAPQQDDLTMIVAKVC